MGNDDLVLEVIREQETEELSDKRKDELRGNLKKAMTRYQSVHNDTLSVADIRRFVEDIAARQKVEFLASRLGPISQKDIYFLDFIVKELEGKVNDAKSEKTVGGKKKTAKPGGVAKGECSPGSGEEGKEQGTA